MFQKFAMKTEPFILDWQDAYIWLKQSIKPYIGT